MYIKLLEVQLELFNDFRLGVDGLADLSDEEEGTNETPVVDNDVTIHHPTHVETSQETTSALDGMELVSCKLSLIMNSR